jgi:hypothetical protein
MSSRTVLLACCIALLSVSSRAVVILDSTWKQEGGTPEKPAAGFGAHIRLARQPQFAGVVAFSGDGESWGDASGTWIGNDQDHAYILTAGHVYDLPVDPGDYVVRAPNGAILKADRVWTHPRWNGDLEARTGFDLAIVRLERPIKGAGEPPLIYRGDGEAGQLITFVGYGTRGIGSKGEDETFNQGDDKAAAQGIVDDWTVIDHSAGRRGDAGNYLGIYLPREDGKVANPHGGKTTPATPLVGLLGAGDSGGSAWMQVEGKWVIVGVSSNGDGDAGYGDSSWFTRVSPHSAWIAHIFPEARFIGTVTRKATSVAKNPAQDGNIREATAGVKEAVDD